MFSETPRFPESSVEKQIQIEGMQCWVASHGGCGTNMLVNFLDNYIKIKTPTWHTVLCHYPTPIQFNNPPPNFKAIYIYGDPCESIISQFRRDQNMTNISKINNKNIIQTHKSMTNLNDYIEYGKDWFGINHQVERWLTTPVNYPILFLRYDQIHQNVENILNFLELPLELKDKFPEYHPRKSKMDILTNEQQIKFRKMYSTTMNKMNILQTRIKF